MLVGVLALHAAVDVGRLLVDGGKHAARFAVELVLALVVAYSVNHTPRGLHQVDVGFRLHLAGNHHLSSGHKRLARHFRLRVVGEQFVNDGIGNLVSHFVGMTFRNRFRSKQIIHLSNLFLKWKS